MGILDKDLEEVNCGYLQKQHSRQGKQPARNPKGRSSFVKRSEEASIVGAELARCQRNDVREATRGHSTRAGLHSLPRLCFTELVGSGGRTLC